VVYAGPVTRYLVDVDEGVRLTSVTQNHSRATDLAHRGDRVRVMFGRSHLLELGDESSAVAAQAGERRSHT
jgi:putative spermidine/putrescine transport system ATP-binding protein